jgi:arylsulfatase A
MAIITRTLLGGLVLGAVAVNTGHLIAQPDRPPNIVIILADDLGYGDLGAFGAPNIRTPRLYGDVIEEIDWSTGQVVDALRTAGIDRQTLVVFTSDNGPWLPFETHSGSAGPLREGKGTTWEGGVRAPAIFWWPGTVRPGTVTDMGSGLDMITTAAALSGARLPADRVIDGVDLSAPLRGSGPSPRDRIFYYSDNELRAVRKGRYKAHFITMGAYDLGDAHMVRTPPLLFDLAADPGERFDIAAAHADIIADLLREADAHRRTVTPTKALFDELLPATKP